MTTIWKGTQEEFKILDSIARNNCTCTMGPLGFAVVSMCKLHYELYNDQGLLDRLLFARRDRQRLLAEEFQETTKKD